MSNPIDKFFLFIERSFLFRLADRILDAIFTFFQILFMPERHRKGTQAEIFVDEFLFPEKNYDMLHRTVDYQTNKWRRVKDSSLPDFRFRDRANGSEFWVEVKYRSEWKGDKEDEYIDFLDEEYKLERYKEIDKELPVFIAICTGHTSLDPAESFLIPVRFIKLSDRIFMKYLLPFQTHTQDQTLDELDISVSSESLWKRLNQIK